MKGKLIFIASLFVSLSICSAPALADGCSVNPTKSPVQWPCLTGPQPVLQCGWIDTEGEPRSSQVHAIDINGGNLDVGDEILLYMQVDRLPLYSYGQQIFQRMCLPSELTLVQVERLPCEGMVLQPDTRIWDYSDPNKVLIEMAYGLTPCEDPMVTIVRLRLVSGTPGQKIVLTSQAIRLDEPNYERLLARRLTLTIGDPL